MTFEVRAHDPSGARLGRLELAHGPVDTPVFMPVGTQATVKTMTPVELVESGSRMLVCNTYHLYLRPGPERLRAAGGLHRFMGWDGPILTDSGGFQVYSLAALSAVSDEGVRFQSHIDGSRHFFTPKMVVDAQQSFGADIAMCLDECPPYPVERGRAEAAVLRTTRWADESKSAHGSDRTSLFAIVQGATYADLRRKSARDVVELGFEGYAIGGLCLGESADARQEMVAAAADELPATRPRYLMGAGYPEDIVAAVRLGVDMFDCVLPTRNGRTGSAFTSTGRLSIRNACYAADEAPLDAACECYACRVFTRGYLRHLFIAGEALGPRLLTLHNVWFYQRLMGRLRAAIAAGTFEAAAAEFLSRYQTESDPEAAGPAGR